ncbi:MAG: hypothetical protein OSJ37_00980 [Muribaculaceae bacterium]|jgi:preprotein translocase subunit SecD|nr:hypothetical protein [Muribaculaceae bacterium]
MTKKIYLLASFVSILMVVVSTACGNTSTTKTEKVDGIEWNVSLRNTVQFNDSLTGISTYNIYTVADTASVNEKLLSIRPENLTLDWTLPSTDGTIWLVAYESEPILSEKVSITEANSIPAYGGNIQIGFKFSNTEKWATITRENIGKRLALFVNGQLMNAPQVNNVIESGYCSVSIPANMVTDFLPNLDLEKIKQ